MNLATTKDKGVTTTTVIAIGTLVINIKTSVINIVMIPENKDVLPNKSPSETESASAITRLTRSPCLCESIKESGSFSMTPSTSRLISLTTPKHILLLQSFIRYAATALATAHIPITISFETTSSISTFPMLMM